MPQLLGHAVADLRVSRDPDDALIDSECRSEVRLGAVWHGHDAGVAADPADIARRAEPLPDGPERAGLRQEWRQYRQVRQSMTGLARLVTTRFLRGPSSDRAGRLLPAGVLDLGIDRGDIEIDRLVVGRRGVARREIGRDAIGDAPLSTASAAQGRRRRVRHRGHRRPSAGPAASLCGCGGCPAHPAAIDLARRGKEAHVGLAELERVEAVRRLAGSLAGPGFDAVSRGIEEFVESLDLIRLEP